MRAKPRGRLIGSSVTGSRNCEFKRLNHLECANPPDWEFPTSRRATRRPKPVIASEATLGRSAPGAVIGRVAWLQPPSTLIGHSGLAKRIVGSARKRSFVPRPLVMPTADLGGIVAELGAVSAAQFER